MTLGNITNVLEEYAGSELAADVIAGATTITVVDPLDYADDGGVVSFTDGSEVNLVYTTVDDVMGIVTLAAPLALGHANGDLLQIQPLVVERYAYVAMEDQDEAVEALVPHALYDRIAAGIRDETNGESELVDVGPNDSGVVVVLDVVDRAPAVDGTFITPATRPPASTDGLPPAISPTPTIQPGLGTLFVSWPAIANADPVDYEVHVSTTTGFTPGPTTLSATTGATQAVIRTLPDGTPLDYATTYYVRLIATDADGAAAAGTQASGTPVQVTGPDIAAASITGDNILGNTITADLLNSVLAILGTIETADSGQRVVLDAAGLHLFASDGSTIVDLPTDPTKDGQFAGQVDAAALAVTGLAQLAGETQVLPNGEIHLVGGQPDPNLAPALSGSYPVAFSFDFNVDGRTVTGSRISHYSATGGSGGTTPCYYGTLDTLGTGGTHYVYLVEWLASNGHINRSLKLDQGVTVPPVGFGACLVGSTIVALNLASATSILQLQNISLSTFALISNVTTANQPGSSNLDPATSTLVIGFGCDGTNPYVFSYNGTTKLPNKIRCTMSGGVATGAMTVTAFSSSAVKLFSPGDANNLGDAGGPINILGAAWDGTNWLINFSWGNSGGALTGRVLQMYNGSTGAIVAKQEVYLPFSVGFFGGGITYDGTDYYLAGGSATTTNRRVKGTAALTWDYTLGRILYAGYTWSNGTVHTGISPVAQLSMESGITAAPLQRQTVVVTMPAIPALATQNLLYALFSTATPAGSSLKLQSATTHASTNTSPTVTFLTYDAAGATPTASTYTSGGSPAVIQGDGSAVSSSWKLDSSGAMVWSVATKTQRDALTPAAAAQLFSSEFKNPEFYDGATWHHELGAHGGEIKALRRKLFEAAGSVPGMQSANFDPADMTQALSVASGGRRYMAVYWPGGNCTGAILSTPTAGAYTDTAPNSGVAIYSSSGTTLTRQATLNQKFTQAGLRRYAWTGGPVALAAGIYYVAFEYFQTAVTTAPQFGGMGGGDATALGGDANQDATPTSWPLLWTDTGATGQNPATVTISGLTIGSATALPFAGLY
jgi:hypothetical protein